MVFFCLFFILMFVISRSCFELSVLGCSRLLAFKTRRFNFLPSKYSLCELVLSVVIYFLEDSLDFYVNIIYLSHFVIYINLILFNLIINKIKFSSYSFRICFFLKTSIFQLVHDFFNSYSICYFYCSFSFLSCRLYFLGYLLNLLYLVTFVFIFFLFILH